MATKRVLQGRLADIHIKNWIRAGEPVAKSDGGGADLHAIEIWNGCLGAAVSLARPPSRGHHRQLPGYLPSRCSQGG